MSAGWDLNSSGVDPEDKGLPMKRNAIRASSTCSKLIRPKAHRAALGAAWQCRQGVSIPLN